MQTTPPATMSPDLDPVKIHGASRAALIAVMEQPLSLHEAHAALIAAAFTVHQAIEAQQKLNIAQRVLRAVTGWGK